MTLTERLRKVYHAAHHSWCNHKNSKTKAMFHRLQVQEVSLELQKLQCVIHGKSAEYQNYQELSTDHFKDPQFINAL